MALVYMCNDKEMASKKYNIILGGKEIVTWQKTNRRMVYNRPSVESKKEK